MIQRTAWTLWVRQFGETLATYIWTSLVPKTLFEMIRNNLFETMNSTLSTVDRTQPSGRFELKFKCRSLHGRWSAVCQCWPAMTSRLKNLKLSSRLERARRARHIFRIKITIRWSNWNCTRGKHKVCSVHCLYSSVTQTLCKKSRTTHKPVGIEIIRSFEMQSCLPTFDCPEHRRWLRDPESERLRVREILSMRLNMMLTICGYRD